MLAGPHPRSLRLDSLRSLRPQALRPRAYRLQRQATPEENDAMRRLTTWAPFLAVWLSADCSHRAVETGDVTDRWRAGRVAMVDEQLRARGIRDARVLEAMSRVPRHVFVPESERDEAYGDYPLPIGHGQTISQPYIVAFMSEALQLEPAHRVLEIGTGSGYQAAVLAELAGEVYTIEIIGELAARADATLREAGYRNVTVRTGNGYLGWPEHAPYDRIMVTAAPDQVPQALVDQLKIGGLMAIPVGTAGFQELRVLKRTESGLETLATLPVRFVPMTGKPKI